MIPESEMSELRAVSRLLDGAGAPWCVCGGWAIDLYLDRVTRPHKDIDIAISRCHQLRFQSHLNKRGWVMEVAGNGVLTPWEAGQYLELPAFTIFCRRGERFVELLFNEWDSGTFRFRRDRTITLPASQAAIGSKSGLAILAPEIVLLYKSSTLTNPDYVADFENCRPALTPTAAAWLRDGLTRSYASHPWLDNL